MQTLVGKHLHKAVEPPIIIYHTVTDAPLVPLFGGLLSFFLNDHLPLGKIADYHSPFSQLVCDEMRSFMQPVSLFVRLAFGDPLVHLGEMDVPACFLLAAVTLGRTLVKLFVVLSVAIDPYIG